MKSKRGWAGAFCCFLLFIVVYLSHILNVRGAFQQAGHPELGLLFFIIPGAVASFVSTKRRVVLPVVGAMLGATVCFVLMLFFITPIRSVWQEMAWLFSAVFWCALGALCYLFIRSLLVRRGRG